MAFDISGSNKGSSSTSKSSKLSSSLSLARDKDDDDKKKTTMSSSSSRTSSSGGAGSRTSSSGGAGSRASSSASSAYRSGTSGSSRTSPRDTSQYQQSTGSSGWSGRQGSSSGDRTLSQRQVEAVSSASRKGGFSSDRDDRDRYDDVDRSTVRRSDSDRTELNIRESSRPRMDTPLVALTGSSMLEQTDWDGTVWSPSTATQNADVRFTSPAWNWVADKADRGVAFLEQMQEDYNNSGFYNSMQQYNADREAWIETMDDKGWGLGAFARGVSPLLFGARASEQATLNLLQTDATVALSPLLSATGPYEEGARITFGDVLTAAGTATNQTSNILSTNYIGPTYDIFSVPTRDEVAERGQQLINTLTFQDGGIQQEEQAFRWWDIFTNSLHSAAEVNAEWEALTPEQRLLSSPTMNQLSLSNPVRTQNGLNEVLTQQARIDDLRLASDQALERGDMLEASRLQVEANELAGLTPVDIGEKNQDILGTTVGLIVIPDMFDLAATPLLTGAGRMGKRLKAVLSASEDPAQSAEAATLLLKGALDKADELAQKVDVDIFREWQDGGKNFFTRLFENTRQTEAERVAAEFIDSFTIALKQAQGPEEAKLLLRSIFDGSLFNKNPDLGRNPFLDARFLKDMQIIKQAEDLILNAKTLNTEGEFNRLLILGEVEDIIWRNTRRIFGLDTTELPVGAVYTRSEKLENGKYVVHLHNMAGDALETSEEMVWKEAKKQRDLWNQQIKEGLSKPKWMRPFDWQRSVLSTMYLNLAPRHWIRNAIAAYAALGADDALNFQRLDLIGDHYAELFAGGAPNAEMANVFLKEATEGNRRLAESFLGQAVETMGKEVGDTGSSSWLTFKYWKKYNPMVWLDSVGNRIWTGTGEIPIPGTEKAIPYGEEAFRARATYAKFTEFLNNGVDKMTEDLASAARDLQVDPATASALASTFNSFAKSTSKNNVFKAMQQAIGSPELAANLEAVGIQTTRMTVQARRELEEIFKSGSADDLGGLKSNLFSWFIKQTESVRNIIEQTAPQPGRSIFTMAEQLDDVTEGISMLKHAAKQAGLDVEEAGREASRLMRAVVDNETAAYKSVIDIMSNSQSQEIASQGILFLNKLHQAKWRIREEVMKINKQAAAAARAGNPQEWAEAARKVSRLWDDYSKNVTTWADDIYAATLNTVRVEQRIFKVGDVVKMADGSEGRVAQVLDENDLISYRLQPVEAAPSSGWQGERVAQASDLAEPDRIFVGSQGSTTSVEEANSQLDRLMERYLAFDVESNQRLREAGATSDSSDEQWAAVITAGREYMDQAFTDALAWFWRYPSIDFMDHIASADKEINRMGAFVALKVNDMRTIWLDGGMTKAQFYEQAKNYWNDLWEFGHQRYRFATKAGLREGVGAEALEAFSRANNVYIPPEPSIDDIRRLAGLAGRSTERGDKRLLNSIGANLDIRVSKLDDLTPDQRRQVGQFYLDEARENGVDVETEFYKWRTPDTQRMTGFSTDADFDTIMWELEQSRQTVGNIETPTWQNVAGYEFDNYLDIMRKAWDNKDQLLSPITNNMTGQQQVALMRVINKMSRQLDDLLYGATKVGTEAATKAMLDYRNRRNIDTALSVLFPYHYYFTRAPMNWLKRVANRPGIAYDAWLVETAVAQENERFDGPQRADGTIPNPFRQAGMNLANNFNAPGVADWIGKNLPNRMYFSLEYAIPYAIWNEWVDPENAATNWERAYLNTIKFTPGLQPAFQLGASAAFDFFGPPPPDGRPRLSEYELGDYIPLARMGGYAFQGITGRQLNRMLGDAFDPGRIDRVIYNNITAGEYDDPYIAGLARAQLENQMRGYPPLPEMLDPKVAKEIEKIVKDATKAAGWERFSNMATGYLLGFAGQNVPDIEREFFDMLGLHYDLGYQEENPAGSQAAMEEYGQTLTSGGVPFEMANQPGRSRLYDINDPEIPLGVQIVTREYWREYSEIMNDMSAATGDYIAAHGFPPEGDVREFQQPFWDRLDALKETYPSAAIDESSGYEVPYTFGANPFEAAQKHLIKLGTVEPPGKPEWPGEDATPRERDNYSIEMGMWRERQLDLIETIAEAWQIAAHDIPFASMTGDEDIFEAGKEAEIANLTATAVLGRYAQDLVDAAKARYQTPIEIEYRFRHTLRSEVTDAARLERNANIRENFGEDGYDIWLNFQDIPEGPGDEYWTEAHEEYVSEHPEIRQMMIFDMSPELHDNMLARGGDRVFEALVDYPGDGTKSEKAAWRNRWPRQYKTVYWYFGENDGLRSSLSQAYDQGDQLALDPWSYTGPRPVGSDREPIGGVERRPDAENYSLAYAEQQEQMTQDFGYDVPFLGGQAAAASGTIPGVNAPPASSAKEVLGRALAESIGRDAAEAGHFMEYVKAVDAAIQESMSDSGGSGSSSRGGGGGGGGYWRNWRRYGRRGWRRYGRRRSGGRRWRRYGRSGGYRRRRSYGGGYGGGGSTVEEGQELFLNQGGPQIWPREFSSWLMPTSGRQQIWRPTASEWGFTARQSPRIRESRRYNVDV